MKTLNLLAALAWAAPAFAAPPHVNLLVETRVLQAAAEPAAAGDVVVGTRGSSPPEPGSVVVRAGPGDADESPQAVLVANGASAALRTTRLRALPTGEWVSGGTRASGVGRTQQWVDAGAGFAVKASWPGGHELATVEVSTSGERRSQTSLLMPLDVWTSFARFGAGASETVLQLRVRLVPPPR